MAQSTTPEEWKECVRQRYPQLLQRAHFLPPVYMSRQVHQTDTQSVPGVELNIPQSPVDTHQGGTSILKDNDVRDDRTQQVVLKCLGKIADGQLLGIQPQVMFVLSQLNFGDYLKDPCYKSALVCLPRPQDQEMKDRKLNQGDFDIVIIHRQHGLLAGEIKSVGINAGERGLTDGDVLNVLRKTMKMGRRDVVGQMGKAREVLTHMMSDLMTSPAVKSTLFLPYISISQLQRILQSHPDVKQKLCLELDIPADASPTGYCFCSDHASDDNKLQQFWATLFSTPCQAMSDGIYEDIVARFAGPATVVRIHCPNNPMPQLTKLRTEGEFVDLTGERTAADVFTGTSLTPVSLYPDQVQILQAANEEENRYVYLAGPPGTGKTLMLVLAALSWLRLDTAMHVFVLVTLRYFNTAVGYFILQQLKETARITIGEEAAHRVHLLKVELNAREGELGAEINRAVETLAGVARDNGGQLCLIADETSDVQNGLAKLHERLQQPPFRRVRLWAASYEHRSQPHGAKLFVLNVPLRCPPYVTQEVQETAFIRKHKDIKEYTEPSSPPPSEGPRVIRVYHHGHSGRNTTDCQQCGHEIALILKDRLHIGQAGGASSRSPQYMDVFVLTHQEGDLDQAGVVVGLRQIGVPVRVVKKNDDKALDDVGTRQGPDHVIVTYAENVRGLERKVVVFLQGNKETVSIGRLNIASRCTSQLIWVQ